MARRRNRIKSVPASCGYCGELRVLETEHVIPQSLFPRDKPDDFIKVKSCRECNGRKSHFDQILRDYVALDALAGETTEGRLLLYGTTIPNLVGNKFVGPVGRAIRSNRSHVARLTRSAMTKSYGANFRPPDGQFVTVELQSPEIGEAFRWVARGVYAKIKNRNVPESEVIEIRRYFPKDHDAIQKILDFLANRGYGEVGNVFQCWYTFVEEDDRYFYFLFRICDHIWMTANNIPDLVPDGGGNQK